MDQDLRKSLLTKKNIPFERLHQQCVIKIQRIKQKNDFIQKQIGLEIQDQMKIQVKRQKQFLEKQIKQLKDIMTQMNNRFKDPESKNKLKAVRTQAQKQIQRNRIILKDLITKSFLGKSADDNNKDQQHFIQGGKFQYNGLDQNQDEPKYKKQSMLTQQHHQIEIDYELEKKMLNQKNLMLQDVQSTTLRVNQIMNDIAVMVNQQGDNLDVISDQLMKANKNVVAANQNLEEAEKYQKKSRKKYILFAVLILLAIGAVVGIVFIFK